MVAGLNCACWQIDPRRPVTQHRCWPPGSNSRRQLRSFDCGPRPVRLTYPIHPIFLHMTNDLQHKRRRARIQPLYREHLAKHFADTYSRIGLPHPYLTDWSVPISSQLSPKAAYRLLLPIITIPTRECNFLPWGCLVPKKGRSGPGSNHEPRSLNSLMRWSPTTAGRYPRQTTRLCKPIPAAQGCASACSWPRNRSHSRRTTRRTSAIVLRSTAPGVRIPHRTETPASANAVMVTSCFHELTSSRSHRKSSHLGNPSRASW